MTHEECIEKIKKVLTEECTTEQRLWQLPLSWTDYRTGERHYKHNEEDLAKFDASPPGIKIASIIKEFRTTNSLHEPEV